MRRRNEKKTKNRRKDFQGVFVDPVTNFLNNSGKCAWESNKNLLKIYSPNIAHKSSLWLSFINLSYKNTSA